MPKRMINIKSISLILAVVITASCASFIRDEDAARFGDFEKKPYILQKDITAGDRNLAKGSNVKIKIVISGNWVKIYAVNTDIEPLKSERVLLLFLFDDDFPFGKFNMELFKIRLSLLVKPK